ncbi:unnamed protein product [Mytilus coruscus]|uniref:Uncharacterized protein n=1 Tax=Mytilus coruscus TaxID=42192 RepID=A0A6J8BRP8_MYTCO|nr:unnamed protein product [Mytilus coruscus]
MNFRFPLRQKSTELSDSVYNQEKINNLLWVFKEEASLILLFLNSLEEIFLYESLGSLYEQNPDYMVTLGGCANDNTRTTRRALQPKCIPDRPLTKMYLLKLETTRKRQPINQTLWLVHDRLVGISDGSKDLLRLAKKLSYLPCVGIAVPMSPNTYTGHIFCFLPLPVPDISMTKLPVHVNGTFALSQNRQNLKWGDKFTVSYKEDSVQWNELLISEVLPKVYNDVIVSITKIWNDNMLIFRCIPDPEKVDYRFKECVRKLFRNIRDVPFLHTESSGDKWIRWQDAVFPIFTENTGKTCKMMNDLSEKPETQ